MKLCDDYLIDAAIADAIGSAEDAGYRAQVCPECEENCGWHMPGEQVECEECERVFLAMGYEAHDAELTRRLAELEVGK